MKNLKKLTIFALSLLLFNACGKKDKTDKKDDGTLALSSIKAGYWIDAKSAEKLRNESDEDDCKAFSQTAKDPATATVHLYEVMPYGAIYRLSEDNLLSEKTLLSIGDLNAEGSFKKAKALEQNQKLKFKTQGAELDDLTIALKLKKVDSLQITYESKLNGYEDHREVHELTPLSNEDFTQLKELAATCAGQDSDS